MSRQAKVSSFAMLRRFRASLMTFASVAAGALDEAGRDLEGTLLWLQGDQYRYWKNQVRACTERYVRAKLALKQREVLDRALAGTRSSCVDERKAVAAAQRRLREAEHKLQQVKLWNRQLEKESLDFRGAAQRLTSAAETDIPNACARLDKMLDSLEAYVALAPPEMPAAVEKDLEVTAPAPREKQPESDTPSPAVKPGSDGPPDEKDENRDTKSQAKPNAQ
jgi:hypothetical protein